MIVKNYSNLLGFIIAEWSFVFHFGLLDIDSSGRKCNQRFQGFAMQLQCEVEMHDGIICFPQDSCSFIEMFEYCKKRKVFEYKINDINRKICKKVLRSDQLKTWIPTRICLATYCPHEGGLTAIWKATPSPEASTTFFTPIQALYWKQDQIGWDQLFYSCIAVFWAHHIDTTSQGHTNGTIFYSCIIQCIWQYTMDTWQNSNQWLHQTSPNSKWHAISNQVHNIIHLANQDPNLQAILWHNTHEQVMNWPFHQAQHWVKTCNLHIQSHFAAVQQCACLQTHDIQTFFLHLNIFWKNNFKPPWN